MLIPTKWQRRYLYAALAPVIYLMKKIRASMSTIFLPPGMRPPCRIPPYFPAPVSGPGLPAMAAIPAGNTIDMIPCPPAPPAKNGKKLEKPCC